MRFPPKQELERLRKKYPAGSRVKLNHMSDVQAPPPGTLGTITYVDDAGSIGVHWDNGSNLSLIPEAGDDFELIGKARDAVR